MKKRLLPVASLALVLTACSVQPRTQVLVTVDAEPGVRGYAESVGIRIWGRALDEPFDDALALEEGNDGEFPWNVAMVPRESDSSRIFRFEAIAYAGPGQTGQIVARSRLISGYVEGQTLWVYLLLQDSCIGVSCEDADESCRDGACLPIPEMPATYDPDAGLPDAGRPPGSDTCTSSMAELCDRRDNDCDRRVDEEFDLSTDPQNCGGCGLDCERPHATTSCMNLGCRLVRCDDGWEDCDGDLSNGCEADLTSPTHCGGCDNACGGGSPLCDSSSATPTCVSSCGSGLMECAGACVDVTSSEVHCGGCGMPCADAPYSSATCNAGTCEWACDAGFDDCDGDLGTTGGTGCETDTTDDVSNCGRCGMTCLPSGMCRARVCTAGSCGTMVSVGATCNDGNPSTCDDTCSPSGMCAGGACPSMDAGMSDGGGVVDCGGGTFCDPASMEVCCSTGGGFSCCDPTLDVSCIEGDPCPTPDAGADAGFCDSGVCGAGESCCGGNVCCDETGGFECCGFSCCDLSTQYCDRSGTPTCRTEAGVGDAEAGVGDACAGPCMVVEDGGV